MHYEIFPKDTRWLWRFVDEAKEVLTAPKALPLSECVRAIETLRMTLVAPVVVVQ